MASGRQARLRRLLRPTDPVISDQSLPHPQPAQAGLAARNATQARLQAPPSASAICARTA
jgi:hypothetical protein